MKTEWINWTIDQFYNVPKWEDFHNNIDGDIESLVILPTNYIHESGYPTMEFVVIQNNYPTWRISGCSDVLHLDGIGGSGFKNIKSTGGWRMDCLPTSHLIRIFNRSTIILGQSLSSMEIFSGKAI